MNGSSFFKRSAVQLSLFTMLVVIVVLGILYCNLYRTRFEQMAAYAQLGSCMLHKPHLKAMLLQPSWLHCFTLPPCLVHTHPFTTLLLQPSWLHFICKAPCLVRAHTPFGLCCCNLHGCISFAELRVSRIHPPSQKMLLQHSCLYCFA